jgi:hypothetical protein
MRGNLRKFGTPLKGLSNLAEKNLKNRNLRNSGFRKKSMELFTNFPFSYEEKEYEIRVYCTDRLINVVAFHNNHPANGFRHQIQVPKKISVNELLEKEVINELVDISKKDISEKRWERLI